MSLPPNRRWANPTWELLSRDRLAAFRALFLGFALVLLSGLILVHVQHAAETGGFVRMVVAGGLLALYWVHGHRRAEFRARFLPLEGLLVATVGTAMHDAPALIGLCYSAIQFRALYGRRFEATLAVGMYVALYIGMRIWLLEPGASVPAVLGIEVLAFVLGGFLMHTLAEVLARDERRAESLRESEQRFRAVVENLREALLITDRDDRIILANSRVRDVLGYEPDDVIGRYATELLLPPEQASAFADRLERRLSGQVELYEVELIRKDGARIMAEVSASPYRDMAGNVIGTLGAISDITEQKQLEERLRQATHMEAVGQLAGGVAHDFNNLLTVINCHAELLRTDVGQPDATRESATEISRAAQRGATLTAQLLAFSRRQMLQPRRIVLSDIVAVAVPALRRLVHCGVSIDATDDGLRAEINADPGQIQQVLESLVRNASEAIRDVGRITIDTRRARRTEMPGDTALAEAPADHYLVLSVTDTGAGMSDSVRSHLFEPFFTTKGPGEGTGLGLASVYGIVRQSGGLVDVESTPSVGTTFRIYLPAMPAEPVQLRAPALPRATPARIARAKGAR